MTLVGMLSLKGAPGVTTLSGLVATTWPGGGSLFVVEADPAGGDLAGRFGLSSSLGWSSLSSAVRRSGRSTPVRPHLQYLPGGLPVLVSGSSLGMGDPQRDVVDVVDAEARGGLAVVDLGRRNADDVRQDDWLRRCDVSVLVVNGDAAVALHVRAHAARLSEVTGGRLGVVVVGSGPRDSAEVSAFTGIRALGDIPFDPRTAAVASGASSAGRRLDRSALLAAARRLAVRLSEGMTDSPSSVPPDGAEPAAVRDRTNTEPPDPFDHTAAVRPSGVEA